jgi:hypothetical protein
MTTPSPPTRPPFVRNASTVLPGRYRADGLGGDAAPAVPAAMPLGAAYALAVRLERDRAPMPAPGYRLYWMTATRFACRDVVANTASYLVAGRHSVCDVVLDDDPTIALRHLLVRSACLDDGCATLSILDLHTLEGFELSDGTAQRAISSKGPVALRVGAYAIVALPSGTNLPRELPEPVCERPRPVVKSAVPGGPYRVAERPALVADGPPSRITLLPSVSAISERSSFRPVGSSAGQPGGALFEVVLRAATGSAAVLFTEQDLEQGVLLGRAPKCVDAGLRSVLNMGISRVHLLLLRERQRCFAYDLASTQGTFLGGRGARYTELSDEGTTLTLGAVTKIELYWRAIA